MSVPNILWFHSDEQRPDSLSCYGSEWARTPNIDRITSRGTVFRTAVCNSPVCLPSRSSQLSGRYPHEFACLNNNLQSAGIGFPDGYETFPEILSRCGYDTANCGIYHSLAESAFQTNGPTGYYLADYTDHFHLAAEYDETEHHVLKRPGAHHRQLIIAGTYPGLENPCSIASDKAIDYIRDRADGDKPFLLRVGYAWPHTPTLAVPPFDSLYDPADLPVRAFDQKALDSRSRFDRCYANLHEMWKLTEEQYGQLWKDYMGCCAYVDFEVGRVLDAIESSGLADRTIIIYSSDHGKSLGEWGTGEKCTFDTEVWRIPFVWSFPGVIPEVKTIERPCELLDTARTLFSILGINEQLPGEFRGRDLFEEAAAVESGETSDECAVFGVFRPPHIDIPDFDPGLMRIAVRTASSRMDVSWKTDGSQPGPEILDGNFFDLEIDPLETRNRFSDPTYRRHIERNLALLRDWIERCPPDVRLANPENAGVLF